MNSPIVPERGEVTVRDAAAIELRAQLHAAAQAAVSGADAVQLHAVHLARELTEAAPDQFRWKDGQYEYEIRTVHWTLTRRSRLRRTVSMVHPHGARMLTMRVTFGVRRRAACLWDPRQDYTDTDGKLWTPSLTDRRVIERSWADGVAGYEVADLPMLKRFAADAPTLTRELATYLDVVQRDSDRALTAIKDAHKQLPR